MQVCLEQDGTYHVTDQSRITDELRKWAGGSTISSWTAEHLTAIADRIDAEHERQLEVLYRDMSDAEYVKLHKDADGEYIHEHDKVDWRDHAGTWHENATVVALCNDGCYVMYALDGMVIHVNKSDIRHHHAPTVEDVLREFAHVGIRIVAKREFKEGDFDLYADEEAIAKFAANMREAMGE